MSRRWKILAGLAAVMVTTALLLQHLWRGPQRAVQETRRALREQGFKTDLADFDFSTSGEFLVREAAITNVIHDTPPSTSAEAARRRNLVYDQPQFMSPLGPNSALVVWKQDRLETEDSGEDLWPLLRDWLEEERTVLDAACLAVLSGPIRFNMDASAGASMLIPQLGYLRIATQEIGQRAVLEMHNGNRAAAWTNLLAVTRLVTTYEFHPIEISHQVRIACSSIAYDVTWQLLQAHGWSDDQLAQLQHEWESLDYFRDLPETVAFSGAVWADACQRERLQPLSLGLKPSEIIRSPSRAWSRLSSYRRQLAYRNYGSYEDEKALLLFYRDREVELRRAAESPTWLAMRRLPGVTNSPPFQSKHASFWQSMLTMNQANRALQRQGKGFAGSAAEPEARRRLLITAIALARYRVEHGSCPAALEDLVPDYLDATPIDFMDGQPLRYRRTEDGHFFLYSVGLDCSDDGGNMLRRENQNGSFAPIPPMGAPRSCDLVWPRPTPDDEVDALNKRRAMEREERRLAELSSLAEERRAEALERARNIALLEELYSNPQPRYEREPLCNGQPISEVLGANISETNRLSLNQMLTIRQVHTGEEPEIATFEVPISFDALVERGGLILLVDTPPNARTNDDPGVLGGWWQSCDRASNGNCLLTWHTTYDSPGKHFVQAKLTYALNESRDWIQIRGPLVSFYSSNICQFDPAYSQFDGSGATLHAWLPESNGVYSIEVLSPDGARVKTFKGKTSNGVICVPWNLIDDEGRRYTNDLFQSIFRVTLPNSGRSQTQRNRLPVP